MSVQIPGYRQRTRTSLFFLVLAIACLLLAEIEIYHSDPWLEFQRLLDGLLSPSLSGMEGLAGILFNTVSFALIGVAIGSVFGLLLAIGFDNALVRTGSAFIRAIHELFWALILAQLLGFSALAGILAIAIPYSGIFAKVYAEIVEEASDDQRGILFGSADSLSRFFYSDLPDAWTHIRQYTLYRLECGLRSSAILGFIGLPTLGFYLESYFSQGHFSQVWALLIIFYVLIASVGLWMNRYLLPVYLALSIAFLPPLGNISLNNITRFFTHDIVPAPLRNMAEGPVSAFTGLADWAWSILYNEVLPGTWNTLLLTQISLVATAICALLLFPLVSSKFFGRPVRTAGHVLLVIMRSTPEYILAFILLQMWGPSMLPAIVAIALHNGAIIGHLVGRHSGSLALRLDSSRRRINRYLFDVVPRIYGQFLAFLFYRWEVIFRETAILGLLGIHTLGFYIDSAIHEIRFDKAMFLILVTAFINIGIDKISRRLRARLRLNYTTQV